MIFDFVKLWYFLCIFTCVINLIYLVMDSRSVKYLAQNPGQDNQYNLSINFWLCTEFKEIKAKSDLDFLNDPSSFSRLFNGRKTTVRQLLNQTVAYLESKSQNFQFNLNKCHLFNKHFCFPVVAEDFNERLDHYLSTYDIKMFAFSDVHLPRFYRSIYAKKAKFQMASLKIHQQKIINKNNPFLECVHETQYGENTKFNCLKFCFNNINSTNIYFDFGNRNLEIYLDSLFTDGYENEQEYRECLSHCKETVCDWETYNTITFEERDLATFKFIDTMAPLPNSKKIDDYQLVIESVPSLESADFWLQLVGLITLFTGTSFVDTTPQLVEHVFKAIKKEQLFKRFSYNLQFGLITFALIFLVNQSSQFVDTYHQNLHYPEKNLVLNFSFEPQPFSLVVCAPVQLLMLDRYEITKETTSEIIDNLTFGEIENRTNGQLDKVLDRVFLKYAFLKKNFSYSVTEKVIFRMRNLRLPDGTGLQHFQRCFRLNINMTLDGNELNSYTNMNTIATLAIALKNETVEIFLLDERLNLASDQLFQASSYKICQSTVKKSVDSFAFNCTDFLSRGYCDSQINCITRCINRRFMHASSSISAMTIVDKDDFAPNPELDQIIWPNTSEAPSPSESMMKRLESSYFNLMEEDESTLIFQDASEICDMTFDQPDCNQIKYRHTYKKSKALKELEIEIDLYVEKVLEIDIEPELKTTVLLILNLESVLFGTNFSSLVANFFFLIRLVFKLRQHRFYRLIALFLCLIGLIAHLLLVIVSEILTEKPADVSNFEMLHEIQLPNLIFCFKFDGQAELDENHLLTGNYLDQLTQELTFDKIFDKISYFNKETFVSVSNLTSKTIGSSADSIDLELSYFFWLDLKCFEIDNRLVYKETDFFFEDEIYSIKLQLNKRIKRNLTNMLFFYRHKGAEELTEYFDFNLDDAKFKVKFEMFELQVDESQFELLKNPVRLFMATNNLHQPTVYLTNLKNDFRARYNLSTTIVPLEERDFQLMLNDQVFDNFYELVQRPFDERSPSRTDSQRTIYNMYEQRFVYSGGVAGQSSDDEPDLSFGIDFAARFMKVSSKNSFPTLCLNILNSLSLFCNYQILEFHKCIVCLAYPFKFVYRYLIRFRDFIKPEFI